MPRTPFRKPHLSLDEQIQQLEDRGMIIRDKDRAKSILGRVGYYHLGFYWYDYEANHQTHDLRPGTDFDHIVELYEFDRKFRTLVWRAIERIEIFARVQWAHHMSAKHGAHAHCVKKIHHRKYWQENLNYMMKEVADSHEPFIQNFMNKYSNATPPIWAVVEIMTLGSLTRWYRSLEDREVQWAIAGAFKLPYPQVRSSLHHLSAVRNTCAHHERLWNRSLRRLQVRRFPRRLSQYRVDSDRVYNTLLIIIDLLKTIDSGSGWKQELIALIQAHPSVPQQAMGFPQDWQNLGIWK